MIGLLRGQLAEKRTNQVLVDVGGVGYQVAIPLSTFYALGELRVMTLPLLIHTHLREERHQPVRLSVLRRARSNFSNCCSRRRAWGRHWR